MAVHEVCCLFMVVRRYGLEHRMERPTRSQNRTSPQTHVPNRVGNSGNVSHGRVHVQRQTRVKVKIICYRPKYRMKKQLNVPNLWFKRPITDVSI